MLNLFTKLSGLIFWLFDQPCKHLLFWFQDLWKIIMLRHSGCWYFDKMSFGQFGSGDDVIAGASVQSPWLNRFWSYKCNTEMLPSDLYAAAAMLHHKCWKMRDIIYDYEQNSLMLKVKRHHCIAHALRRIYLSNHFFLAIGRDFLFGVYWTMFKAHCLLIPVVRTGSAHEFAPEELFSVQ